MLVVLLTQGLNISGVDAQSFANAYQKCDEGVHPFYPGKPVGSNSDIHHPGESHCSSSLVGSFPNNQHEEPDPAEAAHSLNSTTVTIPKAVHWHRYINESVSDDGFYKRAWLRTFEIKLQPDLKAILKPGTLKCPIPDDGIAGHYDTNFEDCPSSYTNANVFGGTKLEFDGTTIKYTFGLNQPTNGYKPIVPGKNTDIDQGVFFPGDTSSPNGRMFAMGVDFETKDLTASDPNKIWGATTTSRAEIIHTAIPKSEFDTGKYHQCGETSAWNANNSWCNVTGYQWVNIGSVVSIWKNEAPPPPTATCEDITLVPNKVNAPGTTDYTATVTFDDGSDYKTEVTWSQKSGDTGTFSNPLVQNHFSPTFTNSYTTTATSGEVTAKVTGVTGANNSPKCQAGVKVKSPPSLDYCHDVTIYRGTSPMPGAISVGDPTDNLYVKATVDAGKDADFKWRGLKGISNQGTFTGGSPSPGNPSTTLLAGDKVSYTGGIDGTIVSVQGIDHATGLPLTNCKDSFKISETPETPSCLDITLTPSNLSAPGSTNLKATVTYSDGVNRTTGVSWSQTGTGSFSASSPQTHSSSTTFDNTYTTPSDTASVTAKVTSVPAGVDNSDECQNGITIKNTPPGTECKTLNPNPGKTVNVDASSNVLLSGSPENTDGTKPSKIHWSETGGGWFAAGPFSSSLGGALMGCMSALPTDPHSANTSFSAPYQCDYYYFASADGTGSAHYEAEPNVGNVEACKADVTTSKGPDNNKPYCAGLVLNPNKLDSDGTTDLHVTVLIGNDDGLSHETTLAWSGDGDFTNFSPAESSSNHQKSFGKSFFSTFEANDANNSEAAVKVEHITGIDDSSLGSCKDLNKFKKPNENEKCEYFDTSEKPLPPPKNGFDVCVDSNDEYIDKDGRFTIEFGGSKVTKFVPGCVEVPANTAYKLYATDEPDNDQCSENRNTGKRPPSLEKYVSRDGKNDYRKVISIATNESSVDYKLVFTPSEPNTVAFITDTIGTGIPGVTYGDNGAQPGGSITYDDSLKITEDSYGDLPECTSLADDAPKEHCYNGPDLNGIELVKVSNPVTITYKGKVHPVLTENSCKDGHICQEKFINKTQAMCKIVDSEGNQTPCTESDKPLHSDATVQIFCQYILTRAAGDVYLEKDLDAGVDINKCSKYTSSTGVVITPAPPPPPNTPSTGIPTQIVSINHEICTEGQAGSLDPALKEFYGKDVSANLSSQICEVKLQPGEQWKKSTIVNNMEENKTRISRWKPQATSGTTLAALAGANPDLNVLHVKGGSLTVNEDYTLSDGEGAKTIIVEDGDLIINHNIKYGTCNKTTGVCNVTDTASLAFIVLNGNVYVDPSVTELSGVYFVQGQGDKGHLYPGAPGNTTGDSAKSYNKLEIFGSVYGEIEPLFLSRLYAGDPSQEEAGIVVRFDERVILNTPPGLRDILSVSESSAAR